MEAPSLACSAMRYGAAVGFPASFHPFRPEASTATRVYPASTARPAAVCEAVQSRLEQ